MQSLYGLLGVRPDDDAETIKSAFRKAAKANHPDHHRGDPQAAARFRQISLAYEILSDAEQRAAYDRARGRQDVASKTVKPEHRQSQRPTVMTPALLESELGPLQHKLKRSRFDRIRHVGHGLATGALLAIVLAVGYKSYDRVPTMLSDDTDGVMARQPASADARTAEGDKAEHAAAPQVLLAPLAAPEGAASAASEPDRSELSNVEPVSNPTGQTIAVATRDGKLDIHAGAGVPAKTEGGPPVRHGARSRAPSPNMPARAATTAPSRQVFTQTAPAATPLEEFARQQELRNTAAVEEFKRLQWCQTGYC